MSTIVYVTPPAHGHVNPTLPIVQELINRGEQVICYNNEEFRHQFERVGAAFRPYPATEMTPEGFSEAVQNGNLANASRLVLRAAETLAPFMIDELTREQPDLVIFDSLAVWGKIATTRLKLRAAASITHLVMDEKLIVSLDLLRLLATYLPAVPGVIAARQRLARQYGEAAAAATSLPLHDNLNILFTTRDLQPEVPLVDDTFRFVGPSMDPQTRETDFPFDALKPGKHVYISLGTIHSEQSDFYRRCFEAFGSYPAQFIMSVGKHTDIAALGTIPANFIVRPSVSQLAVLQRADVFITHGGMNSLHEGLYYGVPLIFVPQQYEQQFNARVVAARGAGLVLKKPVTAADLRQALDTVLAEPRYREAAGDLQASLRTTGGYRQAADEIQAYIAQGERVPVIA